MSKHDGLWVIEFGTDQDWGSGVLVFNGTQVLGGDFGYYYSGEIKIIDGKIEGAVNVARFNPNAISVFGNIESFTLLLEEGTIDETNFTAKATIRGTQGVSIEIKGEKKVSTDEKN